MKDDRERPAGPDAPVLTTERLALRPVSTDDLGDLWRVSNEPAVRRYLWDDRPVSEAATRDVIAQSEQSFANEKLGLLGVRLRGGDELLGFCGFVRPGGMEEPELCYELAFAVWGRGIATEAARACLCYALQEVGMERVIAGADSPNAASLRVLEKLGMKPIGDANPNAPDEPYYALYRKDHLISDA